jgi:hypothetical protein
MELLVELQLLGLLLLLLEQRLALAQVQVPELVQVQVLPQLLRQAL